MVNLHAIVIAGWTIFAVCAVASICILTYLIYRWRKNSHFQKQEDAEKYEKQTKADTPKQSNSSRRPISLLDPFTTQVVLNHGASKANRSEAPPDPPKQSPEIYMMSGALQSDPEKRSSEVYSPDLEPPHRITTAEVRDSLDLDSLCSTPFSQTFPDSWGKIVGTKEDPAKASTANKS